MCDNGQSHRFCVWGSGHSARAREARPGRVFLPPIQGRITLFSVPHAAHAAGLLDIPGGKNFPGWADFLNSAKEKWSGSAEIFFQDIESQGITPETIEQAIRGLPAALIGWSAPRLVEKNVVRASICTDLTLTLALFSRRAGDLFIRRREPDFSWANLFGGIFKVQEIIEPLADIQTEPWKRLLWEL